MKTIKKNIYYCDFCRKKGLSSGHMKTHELHCTANPNRDCRVCHQGSFLAEHVQQLKDRFDIVPNFVEGHGVYGDKISWKSEPVTLKEVRRLADNCPMCTLALLRQSGLNIYVFMELTKLGFTEFDFKAELESYMSEQHMEQY